jgi:hypothetical protein
MTKPLNRKHLEGHTMNCPRCECHIADGFYCVRCGHVPTSIERIEQRTDTNASILDMRTPQGSCGILKATLPVDLVDVWDESFNLAFPH